MFKPQVNKPELGIMRDLHVFITSLDGETRHSHGLSARWDYECNQLLRFFLFSFFLLLFFGESGKRVLVIVMMMMMIMTKMPVMILLI